MKKFLCYDTNDAASGKINVDSRGMLKPNSTVPSGSTPYQQLVTDGDGNTQWEDRAFYSETKEYRLPSNTEGLDSFEAGTAFYKVSSDIPDVNTLKCGSIYSNGTGQIAFSLDNTVSYDDSEFHDTMAGCIIVCYKTTINLEESQITVPSTGIYLSNPDLYLKLETVKKIDEKFLPDQTVFYVDSNNNLTDAEGAKITLEQAKAVGLNFIIQTDYGVAKPIYAFYGNGYASFYAAEASSTGNYGFKNYEAGERPIN